MDFRGNDNPKQGTIKRHFKAAHGIPEQKEIGGDAKPYKPHDGNIGEKQ